jgi:hypothetical protein
MDDNGYSESYDDGNDSDEEVNDGGKNNFGDDKCDTYGDDGDDEGEVRRLDNKVSKWLS